MPPPLPPGPPPPPLPPSPTSEAITQADHDEFDRQKERALAAAHARKHGSFSRFFSRFEAVDTSASEQAAASPAMPPANPNKAAASFSHFLTGHSPVAGEEKKSSFVQRWMGQEAGDEDAEAAARARREAQLELGRGPPPTPEELSQLRSPSKRSGFGSGFFSAFLPRAPSGPIEHVADEDHAAFDEARAAAQRRRPRPPSKLPAEPVSQDAHDAFDQAVAKARGGIMQRSPMARLTSAGSFFFGPHHDKQHAGMGDEEQPLKPRRLSGIDQDVSKMTYLEYIVFEIQYKHAIERAMMAGFAVSLLWLTSLVACQSYVYSTLDRFPLVNAVNATDLAGTELNVVMHNYVTCVGRTSATCNTSFTDALVAEVNRCQSILDSQNASVVAYTNARLACSASFGTVVTTINYLQTVVNVSYSPEYVTAFGTANASQCSAIATTLANQVKALRATNTGEDFKTNADSQVSSIQSEYVYQVAATQAYLLQQQENVNSTRFELDSAVESPAAVFAPINASTDSFTSCAAAAGTTSATCPTASPTSPPLMDSITAYRSEAMSLYATTAQQVSDQANNILAQYTPLLNFYSKFQHAMASSAATLDDVNGAISSNGGGNPFNPNFNPNLPQVPTFSSAGFVFLVNVPLADPTGLNAATAKINQNNAVTAQLLANQSAAIIAGQNQLLGANFYADYNPPPFNITQQEQSWAQSTNNYLPDMANNLGLVAKPVANPPQPVYPPPDSDTSDANEQAQTLLQDISPRIFSPYFYDISLDFLLLQWLNLNNLALIMDYTYRALRSITIVYYYLKVSEVMAPPADVRVAKVARGLAQPTYKQPDQAIVALLTNPACNLFLLFLFLVIATTAFLQFYNPLFEAWVDNCQMGCADRTNGTMLSNNAYQVAFQYVTGPGDSLTSTAIDRVNVARNLQCTKNENLVANTQAVHLTDIQNNYNEFLQLLPNVEQFQACVNVSKMDANFGTGVSGLVYNATNGTVLASLHSTLFNPSCNQISPVLPLADFNCDNIPQCNPTCVVDNSTVQYQTWNAACKVEGWIHSGIFSSFLSGMAFILLNVSRWVLLAGVRRVFWRHFASTEYQYLATANEYGDIEYPERVTVEGISMKDCIRDDLKTTIRQFERMGLIFVVGAILLNVPWIVILENVASGLDARPSPPC